MSALPTEPAPRPMFGQRSARRKNPAISCPDTPTWFQSTDNAGRAIRSASPSGTAGCSAAARPIVNIRDMSERLARDGARDPLYDVPFTTGHTGVVSGGTALNIVPDICTFEFEFRSIAADDVDALVDEVIAYGRETLEPA